MDFDKPYMGNITERSFDKLFDFLTDIESFDRIRRIIACGGKEDVNALRSNSSIVIYYDAMEAKRPMVVIERCPTESREDAMAIFTDAEKSNAPGYAITRDVVPGKPYVDIILTHKDILAALGET